MIINVWIEIRDNFTWPADEPENDNELQAKNRTTLALAADIGVVPLLYKVRTQGPRSYALYSLLYDNVTQQSLEQAVEMFQSENPGDTNVMGAWHWEDGRQFGIQEDGSGVPLYPIPGSLSAFMPDDPDGTPNSTLRDVNIFAGQALRQF